MKSYKVLMAVSLGMLVSACDLTNTSSRDTARDIGANFLKFGKTTDTPVAVDSDFRVKSVLVYIGQDIVVSERESFYPGGDIVWRGDPPGDRVQQVKDIFKTAFTQGSRGLNGSRNIVLQVDVRRFHSLTDKARIAVGGVHSITFALQKRDAVTGEAVGKGKLIRADLKALGGDDALAAARLGQTQKVRITDHLADVIRTELASAE
ncbi:MAG: DUF6778 family protein [Paracoccaceae bacterium]